jgi:hypothetical protein
MTRLAIGLTFGSLICLAAVGSAVAIPSDDLRCGNQLPGARHVPCTGSNIHVATPTRELSAQKKRPRVTIYPRRVYPGPYAKRQCYSWLVTEYRVSGTVVTPQMRCWWE